MKSKYIVLWVLVGAILGLAMALGANVMADGDPTTDQVPRTLPYQGTLEMDGQPVQAIGEHALEIEFALYDGQASEVAAYRQTMRIEVFAGRFTATIGPVGKGPAEEDVEIASVIQAADDLYLGMTLLGDLADPEDDVALAGRQRIHATPYAIWTTSATDMSIARDIVVGGNAQIGGRLQVDNGLAVSGSVDVPSGSLSLSDIDPVVVGVGLQENSESLRVDETWLNDHIRTWVRDHCQVRLGWRDSCDNCGSGPSKQVTVKANGTCIGGSGSNTRCRGSWGGVNTDGDVNGDDVFYIHMNCN